MQYDIIKEQLLKEARNAFEHACTLGSKQRIEVYLDDEKVKVSDVMDESEAIVYGNKKLLCYEAHGHNYLEDEIKTWIDYARVIPEPVDDMPLPEPTAMEKQIRELIDNLAKSKGVPADAISSYEVFANLPMTLLGSIEQEIIEYWWNAKDEENGKTMALEQIESALFDAGIKAEMA